MSSQVWSSAGNSHPWTNTRLEGNFWRTFSAISPYELPPKTRQRGHWSIRISPDIHMDRWLPNLSESSGLHRYRSIECSAVCGGSFLPPKVEDLGPSLHAATASCQNEPMLVLGSSYGAAWGPSSGGRISEKVLITINGVGNQGSLGRGLFLLLAPPNLEGLSRATLRHYCSDTPISTSARWRI